MNAVRSLVLGAAVALLSAIGVWSPAPATAHDQLISSSPARDEGLTDSPSEITLVYSGEVMQIGAEILLTNTDGQDYLIEKPSFDGTHVSVALPEALPEGAYTVAWRVVSADGHPISGLIPFTVGDAVTAPSTGEPASQASTPAAPKGAGEPSNVPLWLRPVAIGVGGAAAALLVYGLAIRRKKQLTDE